MSWFEHLMLILLSYIKLLINCLFLNDDPLIRVFVIIYYIIA